ncbi:MAG: DUF502 domain-containing protein [Bacteroidetes bacterium]|nr:DUF502 domain-containing protein [Bacteroidota bacterium]
MKKLRGFVKTTLLGGFVIVLPVAAMIAVMNWIFGFIGSIVQPLTDLIVKNSQFQEMVGDIISVTVILVFCFGVGVIVQTTFGKFLYDFIEHNLLIKIPGFNLIKETILQFVGTKKSPFSSVALARIYQNDTLATAFITDEHDDGSYSVFVPTGPNPTSGQIFHLKREYVQKIDVKIEDAMKSIISMGAGSDVLIKSYNKAKAAATEGANKEGE